MVPKIVADTSALVSIESVELMSSVLQYFEVIIPAAVKSELEEMANYSDVHGKAAKRILSFIEDGTIIVKNVKGYQKHIQNSDLGEAQALGLAKEINASYFISDV